MFAAGKAASGAEPTDAQFNYVTMLLHGNGTNGAQNNTFVDSSTNNFTITRNGNTTQGTFTPYGSNWSNYFDGTGDYLSLASNAAFTVGTGAVTIEAWIYCTSLSQAYQGILSGRLLSNPEYPGLGLVIDANKVQFTIFNQSTGLTDSATVPLNQWVHVAGVRSGTNAALFVNGVRKASSTSNSDNGTSSAMVLGRYYPADNNYYFSGYISNARIVKGTAVYDPTQTTLSVPTAPLTAVSGTSLLTCQGNRFLDASTNNFTITKNGDVSVQRFSPFSPTSAYSTSVIGGSGYFDGTGDYLDLASNAAFSFGTGDFTVEMWLYHVSNGTQRIIGNYASSGNTEYDIEFASNGTVYFGSYLTYTQTSTAVPLNSWTHIAWVRASGVETFYINGVSAGTATRSLNFSSTTGPRIAGSKDLTTNLYNGFISDVRIVKGTAVYTTTFTPPTTPLTAITNTSLLTNFTNAGILDNAMMNDLETVGNAQISTSVKKYGTGSMYFDGTGDYLFRPNSPLYDFGTGDFTLEMWVYRNGSQTAYAGLVGFSVDSGNGLILGFGNADNKLRVIWNNAQTILASTAMTNTTWTHVALVRSGATVTCYQDGTSVGTSNISTSAMPFTGAGMVIGRLVTNTDNYYFNGYIDDLRITKGVARYTTTFTPPTAAFADKG